MSLNGRALPEKVTSRASWRRVQGADRHGINSEGSEAVVLPEGVDLITRAIGPTRSSAPTGERTVFPQIFGRMESAYLSGLHISQFIEGLDRLHVKIIFSQRVPGYPGVIFEFGVEGYGLPDSTAFVNEEDHIDGALLAAGEALGVEAIGEEQRLYVAYLEPDFFTQLAAQGILGLLTGLDDRRQAAPTAPEIRRAGRASCTAATRHARCGSDRQRSPAARWPGP